MPALAQLWAPILLSAFLVFVASSLIHMVFKWHNPDYRKLPNEDEVAATIRKGAAIPGQYVIPHCADMKEMAGADMQRKFTEGPVALVWVKQSGMPNMGPTMGVWFAFNLVIAFLVAYVAAHTVATGSPYLAVFRVVGAVAFLAYSGATAPASIWMGKPWNATLKEMGDGLIYGLLTAGAFGWLWPQA